MKVGFTGTQGGMTDDQVALVVEVISGFDELEEMHHGDCIGADEHFFIIVSALKPEVEITGHLPENDDKRAFCDNDIERLPLPYLERNKNIVEAVDVMIACPKEMDEVLRSGTWATVRHARKTNVPLVIIYSDGKYIYEG